MFHCKAGAVLPKVIVVNDDVDPTDTKELVWAFATRCHPTLGNVVFNDTDTAPLVAYLRTAEKMTSTTAKVVYNCLPPDEVGDVLPVRSSFRHAYPTEIVERVIARWESYGFIDS